MSNRIADAETGETTTERSRHRLGVGGALREPGQGGKHSGLARADVLQDVSFPLHSAAYHILLDSQNKSYRTASNFWVDPAREIFACC
jgi:hypothetical protein